MTPKIAKLLEKYIAKKKNMKNSNTQAANTII